jgi:acetolactate synthase-1/2/3 large subunit
MHKGAEIVLSCLRAEGVELVFGYPGGAIMPLYDALEGSGVRHILSRHEQGAIFAAEGYSRVTGKVGVAFATSGPGATNLITGIADAKMDSVPLVCITGQVRSSLIGSDAFQEIDVFGLTLPLTKWSRLVRTVDEIPAAIAEGFYWARSGRPGPVLIDIPGDVFRAKAEFSGPVKFVPCRPEASDARNTELFARLVDLLRNAKKPVALIGAGAKLSDAIEPLRRLLDRLQVPTCATVHGLGAVDPDKEFYLGMVGDAKIVHFEIDPAQLDRVRGGELAVLGNLADTIPALHQAVDQAALPGWPEWLALVKDEERATADTSGSAEPTVRFLDELYKRLPKNSIVVTDVGQHQMWAAQRYHSGNPRGFITSGGLGSMGFGLPAAVGVQLARAESTVLCISGDGGFQMNIQELATVRRLDLPIKLVIIDNKYLGMVRQWQQLFYNRNYAETDLSDNPDFVEIAKAYRIPSLRIGVDAVAGESISQETSDLFDRFLHSTEPELLVFDCHPEANVFPMVPTGASLSEMLTEDK